MPKKEKSVTIAATADIHVKMADKGKWAPLFKNVGEKADVLVICGDLTDTGDEQEAEILADELKSCPIPVVGVLGNHDFEKGREKLIRKVLIDQGMVLLDGEYTIVGEIGFAGIKGFGGGFDRYMLSLFGEAEMKAFVNTAVEEALKLERALAKLDQEHSHLEYKVALMHYAPIATTVVGEPEQIFPFLGSSRLAEPIDRRNVKITLHGHAHKGTLEGKTVNGNAVYNIAAPVLRSADYDVPFRFFEL
ncbi:metallophosphoesterase family protein [Olivibacter sitiensis]|uniref:metallophosphoesterase family protein n=1 Tax=Olivibacter sitiensis TaxID=376470 RepID=UPI0004173252|nr:metallophosphoesterase [Olivibacter sitiensis]